MNLILVHDIVKRIYDLCITIESQEITWSRNFLGLFNR